jgi:murein DD-endopeptidase MepM/ murein hydrolase activator NlpD
MSGYKKGQMILFVVLVAAGIIIGFYLLIRIIHGTGALDIDSTMTISIEMQDRGTELISLLNSDTMGIKYMEIVGDFSADNHETYINEHKVRFKETLTKIRKNGYSFYAYWKGGEAALREGDMDCSLIIDRSISLMWPVPDSHRITSPYGKERISPNQHIHGGIDISGNNMDVVAAADGVVYFAGWEDPSDTSKGFGKWIAIEHTLSGGKKFYTIYGHLNDILVEANQAVIRGQFIGKTGDTGYSTGPHLHFELADGASKGRNNINVCPYVGNPGGCADPNAPGISIDIYGTQIPLPGAQDGKLKGEAEFLC